MPKSVGKWYAVRFIKKHARTVMNCGKVHIPWFRFADMTVHEKVDHLACRYMLIYKVPMLFDEYEKIVKRIAHGCVYHSHKNKVIDNLASRIRYRHSRKIAILRENDGQLRSAPMISEYRQMQYSEKLRIARENRISRRQEAKNCLYEIAAELRDIKKLTNKLKEYSNENKPNS